MSSFVPLPVGSALRVSLLPLQTSEAEAPRHTEERGSVETVAEGLLRLPASDPFGSHANIRLCRPAFTIGSRAFRTIGWRAPDRDIGEDIAPLTDRIACMITVRKALWHLPTDLQQRLLHRIVARAGREELGSPLRRVSACHGGAGLELEFWFQGCSDEEAMHYASATLRDAAASIAEAS